jgi:geranylgeranylglycerol-phosphate geranylgeranyltransferase
LRFGAKSVQSKEKEAGFPDAHDARRSMQKIKGLYRLFRIELPLAAGTCVLAGGILAGAKLPAFSILLPGFLAGFFISASANILNDLFDLETDRVNAPDRPLPSGAVRPRDVILLFLAASALGLAAAARLGPATLAIGAASWLAGVLYDWKLKETGLPGNLSVSACLAALFVFGGAAAGGPWNPVVWSFAGIIFFFDLGEELGGGVMDMEGDRVRGARTVALRLGKRKALLLAGLAFAVSIAIGLLPFRMGWLRAIDLAPILVMDASVIFFTTGLMKSKTPREGRACLRGNSLGATVCLVAFVLVRLIA